MPTKNTSLGIGTFTLSDENGKEFKLGNVAEMECKTECYANSQKLVKKADSTKLTFTIKPTLRGRLHLKWQIFKMKRRAKKIFKTFYGDGEQHEFTLTFKK